MTRVVADTNVLVRAIQFGGKPKQLPDLAADGHIDLAISEAILEETLSVLIDNSIARAMNPESGARVSAASQPRTNVWTLQWRDPTRPTWCISAAQAGQSDHGFALRNAIAFCQL